MDRQDETEYSQSGLLKENKRDSSFEIRAMPTKVGDIIRIIEQDGWIHVATKGSHRQFKHPVKSGRVTVPGKLSDDLAIGTESSILKQAGLKK